MQVVLIWIQGVSAAYLLLANMVLHLPVVWKTAERKRAHEMTKIGKGKEYDGWVFFICLYSVLTDFMFAYQAMYLIFAVLSIQVRI